VGKIERLVRVGEFLRRIKKDGEAVQFRKGVNTLPRSHTETSEIGKETDRQQCRTNNHHTGFWLRCWRKQGPAYGLQGLTDFRTGEL